MSLVGPFRQIQATAWRFVKFKLWLGLISSSSSHDSDARSEELGRPAGEAIGLQLQSGELKMMRGILLYQRCGFRQFRYNSRVGVGWERLSHIINLLMDYTIHPDSI